MHEHKDLVHKNFPPQAAAEGKLPMRGDNTGSGDHKPAEAKDK